MEREGVCKYHLDHQAGPAPAGPGLAALDAWRTILHRLGLVGQDVRRYEGLGFGNVSIRDGDGFVITGTQTGAPERLGPAGYVRVSEADVGSNRVRSRGPVAPSSEALTHAACYRLDPEIMAVFHVHAPELWRAREALGLPSTPREFAYGTPAMADAVAAAHGRNGVGHTGVIALAGHADGIVALGPAPDLAGAALLAAQAAALALAWPGTGPEARSDS